MGQGPGLVSSYKTRDQIEGSAVISVEYTHEARFNELEIVLQDILVLLFMLAIS